MAAFAISVWDYCKVLLGDKNQYITWILVFVGWIISYWFICVQSKDNKKQALDERKITSHNENIMLFKEKLSLLEELSLNFWSIKSPSEADPQLQLIKMASKIKELTDIARDIERFGGSVYPSSHFRELRMSATSDSELSLRPLLLASHRITSLRNICNKLKKHYSLKE
ncbi:hypothetical protein WKH08_21280 [Pantoea agglomerans]|uniref:hypothetical protein n=1 Tax=Enterobacter agglomerans TaxID=549 RepID=UPI003C79F2A3